MSTDITGRNTPSTGDTVAKIASIVGIALGWLLVLTVAASKAFTVLHMITGKSPLESRAANICDVPNVCVTTGPEGTALPLEAVSGATRALAAAEGIILIVAIIAAAYLGTRAIVSISRGDAFGSATVRRVRWAASALLLGGALTWILEEMIFDRANDDAAAYLSTHPASEGSVAVDMFADIPAMAVMFGVFTLVAWAALRQGAVMREELDSVI